MATLTQSVSLSDDWQIDESASRPISLIVQLRRSAYILPWFRFVYAEGDDSQVRITFATHLVTVSGNGLAALLAGLSTQRVVRVVQPSVNEVKFGVRGNGAGPDAGTGITDITVQKFD